MEQVKQVMCFYEYQMFGILLLHLHAQFTQHFNSEAAVSSARTQSSLCTQLRKLLEISMRVVSSKHKRNLPNMILSSLAFIDSSSKIKITARVHSSNPNLQRQQRDKPKATFFFPFSPQTLTGIYSAALLSHLNTTGRLQRACLC